MPYTCPKNPFYRLVCFLRENGYKVLVRKPTQSQSYHAAFVSRQNIRAAFCETNDVAYRHINGHFAADHSRCFNKWSQCPLVVPIPNFDCEYAELLKNLKWLSSDEGYEWSNSFGYLHDPRLPRDIE
jgi:hypothetical protein